MRTIAFLAVLCCAATARAVPSEFVYQAVPYVLLDGGGNEYTISGTFTTSCNDCSTGGGLSPTDIITGFHIEVSGPTSLEFDSTAGGYLIVNDAIGFTVTPASIQLPNELEQLIVERNDAPFQGGGGWFKGYLADALPDRIQFAGPGGESPHAEFPLSSDPLIVATYVPEPGSLVLGGMASVGLLTFRRRRI
jgi:PEP-CTERM motif